ncbi:MAG: DUF362 domain-containing protein [Thermodesulfobacteriota bacterium]
MLSRRLLLKVLAAGGALLTLRHSSAMADVFFKPKEKKEPRGEANLFTRGGKALVGVSGRGTPEEMVREAVSLIGGFGKLGLKGKTVLVKPNVVSGEPHPSTTNPEVVGAVVRILYEEGAAKVYVGDMSAMLTLSTKRNMRRCGITEAAREAGGEVVVFEDYGWVEVPLKGARYVESAYVTEWLYKADIIVNLPVIKTHKSASYTISLKNFIGCTHLKQRPYLVDSSHWEELVSEFNLAYAPELNIVDGTVSMVEGGPWEGTPADTNIIVASGDRVAADIVGLGVIKSFGKWPKVVDKDVWAQKQIKRAIELGVGRGREEISMITGEGDESFTGLMEKVRAETGL